MDMQGRRTPRRRSVVTAGAVAVLLASGGVAVATAPDGGGTSTDGGPTLTRVSGKPSHVEPATATPVTDGIRLTEVPGAPQDVRPADPATPVTDVPVVGGDEGHTVSKP
ncbi:hypothetical protein [Streptomyces sp. NPDC001980]|uniref:hypothetical protein n=1 Tax=Streptomyces sp. NPDC001980 TaxID=3157126 RepID=UPI003320F580